MRKGAIAGLVLCILYATAAAMMLRDAARDPYDALRVGTSRYGHNYDGALRDGLLAISIELVVALLILRPWSDRGGMGRAGLALLFAVPWAMLSMMMSMHGGGIIAIHVLWMFALCVFLVALAIVRAARG